MKYCGDCHEMSCGSAGCNVWNAFCGTTTGEPANTKPDSQTAPDLVNHPSHYADKSIEVIDYIRDTMSHEHLIGYYWGNIIKYISRWPKKGGAEDLKKARVYLDWLIKEAEGKE